MAFDGIIRAQVKHVPCILHLVAAVSVAGPPCRVSPNLLTLF